MDWVDNFLGKYGKATVLMTVLLVFLLQLQDVKLFGLKSGEFLGLVVFVYSIRKLSVAEKTLIVFFTLFLLVTIVKNYYTYFPSVEYDHPLKTPYLINIARWLEYMSCIGIMVFVRLFLYGVDGKDDIAQLFLKLNVVFSLLIVALYVLEVLGWSFIDIVYGSRNRLKAFFVEGGPYGLYNAILGIVSWLHLNGKKRTFAVTVFSLMIALSQSKAGAMCFLVFFSAVAMIALYRKCSFGLTYKLLLTGFSLLIFVYVGLMLFSPYTQSLFDYEFLIDIAKDNPDHYWINGGRVPGFYIIRTMIAEHPWIGIGVGNYQLLRNSELYLTGFPVTVLWDYHGFGGMVDLLVEFGLIGLFSFCVLIFRLYFKLISWKLMIVLLPFFLGLPLYFHYPWVILVLLIKQEIFRK